MKLKGLHKEQETDLVQEGAKMAPAQTSVSSLEYSFLKARLYAVQNPVELPPAYFSEIKSNLLSQQQTRWKTLFMPVISLIKISPSNSGSVTFLLLRGKLLGKVASEGKR